MKKSMNEYQNKVMNTEMPENAKIDEREKPAPIMAEPELPTAMPLEPGEHEVTIVTVMSVPEMGRYDVEGVASNGDYIGWRINYASISNRTDRLHWKAVELFRAAGVRCAKDLLNKNIKVLVQM